MSTIVNYTKLLRVNQWIKNLLIFAPVFFAFKLSNMQAIVSLLFAFVGFCFVASSVYIINDWCDMESDKLHPQKKNRPLASGSVSLRGSLIILMSMLVAGFSIYIFLLKNTPAIIFLLTYFILNAAYSWKLKRFAIIDVTIVAAGFVIRLFIGGFVASVPLSYWIIILTFLLALLLVLGKRLNDITILEETGLAMRKSIAGYNKEFLNAIIMVDVSLIIISYILYTISPESVARNGEFLYLTSLFVILGLFRYLQALYVDKAGGSPTKLVLTDRFLQLMIVLWGLSFILIYIDKNHYNIF